MYSQIVTPSSLELIVSSTDKLIREVGLNQFNKYVWVAYGSVVTEQLTENSDLDLLFIHDSSGGPYRVQTTFESRSVTIYVLNHLDFFSDGAERKFGGFFSGKVLNPFVTVGDLLSFKDIAKVTAGFIAPFASHQGLLKRGEIGTRENLMADAYLGYLQLSPHYATYFVRYYQAPLFQPLWDLGTRILVDALVESGNVSIVSGNTFEYQVLLPESVVHKLTVESVARFWAFGACSHSCSYSFPDYYFQKADRYIKINNLEVQLQQAMSFLNHQVV